MFLASLSPASSNSTLVYTRTRETHFMWPKVQPIVYWYTRCTRTRKTFHVAQSSTSPPVCVALDVLAMYQVLVYVPHDRIFDTSSNTTPRTDHDLHHLRQQQFIACCCEGYARSAYTVPTVQIRPRKDVLHHADYTGPTR